MGQNSSMGQFTGALCNYFPLHFFSMASTILIGQWPNLLTFRGGDHASATPLESDKMATRAKKAKTKSRYGNKFKTEWSAEFPGIVSSKGNTEKARCVYCGTDFGIGHGGRSDVKRQVARELPLFTDVPADGKPADKPDAWWSEIFKMKGPSGLAMFGKLKRLIHVLLILPYDQAPVERVFSMVNKIDTKFRPSLGNTTVCALLMSQRSTVEYRAPNSMYLLQVNATMTCELREKKQLPTTMLQSSRNMRVMTSRVIVTRTSAFIHYVILLHKYIELPILYKYFGLF